MNPYWLICCGALFVWSCSMAADLVVSIRDRRRAMKAYRLAVAGLRAIQLGHFRSK